MYLFRTKEHASGSSIFQLTEWLNLVLPMKVTMNTKEVEEEITVSTKHSAKKVLDMFKKPTIEFSSQWKQLQRMEKVFTVILLLFLVLRNDLFAMLLMLFYLCYASLFALHIPFRFFYWSSIALSVWIVLKFIVQSAFVSQTLKDGVWHFSGMVLDPSGGAVANSFQWLFILGLYKTEKQYVWADAGRES